MSKIQFEQLSEEDLLVTIPTDTPIEVVNELTKSLLSKGLVEDIQNSTLSNRYFYKPNDKANNLADQLIKSLEGMAKADEQTKMQWETQARNRLADRNASRAKSGLPPITLEQMKNPATSAPAATTVKPSTARPSNTLPGVPNKLHNPDISGTTYKKEHGVDCECDDCTMEKSGYGPKGGGQYTLADNIRRKAKNTGAQTGFGSNINTKQYTSAKFAGKDMQSSAAQKRPSKPVTWTPEQIAAENQKRGLKKGWANHNSIPSAEEEILRLAKGQRESGEQAAATQLANLMMGKQMLGNDVHPMVQQMMAPPPPQPTDEQLFGHLVVSEEMAKKAESEWSGTLNNFFAEATKPLSQRFRTEEEELAYWNSIKVADKDDGKSGY